MPYYRMAQNSTTALTEKETGTLKFILHYREAEGYFPSLREIAAGNGVTAGAIQTRLQGLKAKGFIDWVKGRPRAFKILDHP